jgi:cytoskeletal protein RodZ
MPSFGDELRRERELREIGLREIAEATRISLRYLEALERNDFQHLPGGVFNRGFVRAYCQFIGVDPESMVNAYLMEEQAQAGNGGGPAAGLLRGRPPRAERSPAPVPTAAPPRAKRHVAWILLLVAAGLISALLFLYFWLQQGRGGTSAEGPAALGTDRLAPLCVASHDQRGPA